MATSFLLSPSSSPNSFSPLLTKSTHLLRSEPLLPSRCLPPTRAFQRSDFDGFAKKVASGQAWRDAWRSANDGFEQILYESRMAAQRLDRQYSISTRVAEAARSARDRARELDGEYGVTRKWRNFSVDFSRNWPRYRKEIGNFVDTPLGRSCAAIFFLWFALSGWLFRILFFATWVLPFAAPLLIGNLANNFVIKGSCPACRREFVGYKNNIVRCAGCGNIVWQPKSSYSAGKGGGPHSSTSEPDIIDIEIDDKRS